MIDERIETTPSGRAARRDGTGTAADPDADLVARAAKGEHEAVSELYRRHERRAYNLTLRMLGDPWDAADVTQEAFIKAFVSLQKFKGEARFSTWLHRIVVNAVYDHLRRRHPEPVPDEAVERLTAGRTQGLDGKATNTASDALSVPLQQALLSLADGFRLTVVLCDLLDFTYGEAAEILEVREGTVKSRLFRARAALSERLTNQGYGGEEAGNNAVFPAVRSSVETEGPE